MLLRVATIYPGHLQGATSLVNIYSVYDNWLVIGRLYVILYIIYIYVYSLRVIYDKLPYALYTSTKLVAP
jgi:hypothetical protein